MKENEKRSKKNWHTCLTHGEREREEEAFHMERERRKNTGLSDSDCNAIKKKITQVSGGALSSKVTCWKSFPVTALPKLAI